MQVNFTLLSIEKKLQNKERIFMMRNGLAVLQMNILVLHDNDTGL